ncbi:unnamed protein product [Pylaiella littoralis]
MAMVSPRLHHDIERRVRAEHSLDNENRRSSSVPAALRYHRGDEVTAPAPGGRSSRGSAPRARLITRTTHIGIAHSSSPASAGSFFVRGELCNSAKASSPQHQTDQQRQNQQQENAAGRSSPYPMPKSRATEDAKIGNIERPFSGEDGLSGADTAGEGDSLRCSPKTTTGGGDEDDTEKAERSRRKRGSTPTSDLGTPKKLLELIEDRDRAVHLCLQYRCKLKNTEACLKAEELLASDLKAQLREADAAGEATRKLFDQVMDKVRADEGRKLRHEASTRQVDDKRNAGFAEEARKARLQLVRARKDLRALWLERDELAILAGQATQGEQTCRKRAKKLELVIAGLKEKVSALAVSEQKAAEEKGFAEARATAAEVSERELRGAVEAIKDDFEVLVRDLRLREKQLRQLEAKNSILRVKSATPGAAAARGSTNLFRQGSPESETAETDDNPRASSPTSRCARLSEEEFVEGEASVRQESPSLSIEQRPPRTTPGIAVTSTRTTRAFAATPGAPGRGVCGGGGGGGALKTSRARDSSGLRSPATSAAAALPVARPARKQLAPRSSEIPGRVMTVSYPRCGGRATFTPMPAPVAASPTAAPTTVTAGDSKRPPD